MMTDIYCRKCGEGWNAYGVNQAEDMTKNEAYRFKRGHGCPHCDFGTSCTHCNGTGTKEVHKYAPGYCSDCHGSGRVLARKIREGYKWPGHRFINWAFGYDNDVKPAAEPYRELKSYNALEGWVDQGWSICPTCDNAGEKCEWCDGTGEFTEAAEGDHLEKALESLVESTDEDPLKYLMEYEL
jgi:hypothetical protein